MISDKGYLIQIIILIFFILPVFNGCSDDGSPVNTVTDNLVLSHFTTTDTTTMDLNVLILDTVKVLIKDIKFTVSGTNDSVSFHIGPYLLFLRFNSPVLTISSSVFPSGTYDKIKFEVHKLDTNEAITDPEFIDINGRYSVIAKGLYNGNRFVYKSSVSAGKILQFQNPSIVSSSDITYITLLIRPYIWFLKNGNYLDPGNPANSNDINNNIKNNLNHGFNAFRDNDRNGIPD